MIAEPEFYLEEPYMISCRRPGALLRAALVLALVAGAVSCDLDTKTSLPDDTSTDGDSGVGVSATALRTTPSGNTEQGPAPGKGAKPIDPTSVTLPRYEDGAVDYDEAARILQEELARGEDSLNAPSVGSGVRHVVESDKPLSRIRELTAQELPKQTRRKPDPAVDRFEKDPVYVRITETLTHSAGESRAPEIAVLENYLKEYARRAGHPVVDEAEAAVLRIEGNAAATFEAVLTFKEEAFATKVEGSASITVKDKSGGVLESFEIPPTPTENSLGEEAAFLDLRRYLAKVIWERLSREGKYFGHADAQLLLEALAEGNILEIENLTAEFVIAKLADFQLEAVPLLIEALVDTRTVQLHSTYPGLDQFGAEALKVYHVADKALEEIFQKVSRMNLLTPPRHRFVMVRGWENEWRRFCRPFRESPSAARDLDGES
jgi:hypothetical protein